MMISHKTISAALVGGMLLAAGTATASTVDFTDTAVFPDGSATLGVAGATLSLSSVGGAITQNLAGAPGPIGPLVGLSDGLGVTNDEITFDDQSITVTFSRAVRVTGLYFLDLFQEVVGGDEEVAIATFSGGEVVTTAAAMGAADPFGFASSFFGPITTTSVTFTAGAGNDGIGNADFALAGLEVTPVPVPASFLLLASAFAGCAFIARRNAKA